MQKIEYHTIADIVEKSRGLAGKTFGEIDRYNRDPNNKGYLGSVIEESWFEYSPNSAARPDFEVAGMELKVTPFLGNESRVRAKERLVCGIINYMEEYKKSFFTSSFYQKCANMIIVLYEHLHDTSRKDFKIEKSFLYHIPGGQKELDFDGSDYFIFQVPEKDVAIMENDFNAIKQKIIDGKAHELSERDTLYLGACTKGANKNSVRQQPFSDEPAMQRAFSLKNSYMTALIRNHIFSTYQDQIVDDTNILKEKSLTTVIKEMFEPYVGMSQSEIKKLLGITSSAKHINRLIVNQILNVKEAENSEEFQKANISVKTIRLEANGTSIRESMSFPAFKFKDIVNQKFEESDLYEQIVDRKFLFVVYAKDESYELLDTGERENHIFLTDIFFWQLPDSDIETVKAVWNKTKVIIQEGVRLSVETWGKSERVSNNFPKASDNQIIHIRPHEQKGAYRIGGRVIGDIYRHADLLPNGDMMTRQSFWFNSSYIEEQIRLLLQNNVSKEN